MGLWRDKALGGIRPFIFAFLTVGLIRYLCIFGFYETRIASKFRGTCPAHDPWVTRTWPQHSDIAGLLNLLLSTFEAEGGASDSAVCSNQIPYGKQECVKAVKNNQTNVDNMLFGINSVFPTTKA